MLDLDLWVIINFITSTVRQFGHNLNKPYYKPYCSYFLLWNDSRESENGGKDKLAKIKNRTLYRTVGHGDDESKKRNMPKTRVVVVEVGTDDDFRKIFKRPVAYVASMLTVKRREVYNLLFIFSSR